MVASSALAVASLYPARQSASRPRARHYRRITRADQQNPYRTWRGDAHIASPSCEPKPSVPQFLIELSPRRHRDLNGRRPDRWSKGRRGWDADRWRCDRGLAWRTNIHGRRSDRRPQGRRGWGTYCWSRDRGLAGWMDVHGRHPNCRLFNVHRWLTNRCCGGVRLGRKDEKN